jgi:hypothetical protein
MNAKMAFSAEGNWSFPQAQFDKHFQELTNGVPESARRLKRVLSCRTPMAFTASYR